MTEPAGAVIGGYTIERVLGTGGMGAVYAARHPRLPRTDALKVLADRFSDDNTYRGRFEREADLAGALDHPNIVPVYDRGEDEGRLWMSMKLVPGPDASAMLLQNPAGLPLGQVIAIINAVADALDYAHSKGLLHRDVKPGNILIDSSGSTPRIMLGDFGIARADEPSELTAIGTTVGTVDYCSPEQLSGDHLDGRTDQYSLACTAVHLLTGQKPFGSASSATVIGKHLTAPPPVPSHNRPGLPPAVDGVIARGMAKHATQRFGSCRAFAQALSAAAGTHAALPASAVPDSTTIGRGPISRPSMPSMPVMPITPGSQPSVPHPNYQSPPTQAGPHQGYTGQSGPQQSWNGPPQQSWQQPQPVRPASPTPPAKSGNKNVLIACAVVVTIAAVIAAVVIIMSSGSDDPGPTAPTTSTSTKPSIDKVAVLRENYIDPCKIPSDVITNLGISALLDDPGQRNTSGVKWACKGVDSKNGNVDVKFATFQNSTDWDSGTASVVNDKWRQFNATNTNSTAAGFCVLAYKSASNGTLWIGLQQSSTANCGRLADIARAVDDYLPE